MSRQDDNRAALAMRAAGIQHRLDNNFSEVLADIVFCEINVGKEYDPKACLAAEKKLDSRAARSVLTLMWSASTYVSDVSLLLAGLERPDISYPMTCNALANYISKSANTNDVNASTRLIRDTTRIVRSAEVYGLVRFVAGTSNNKPFMTTALLNKLMLGANLANALIINEIWQDGGTAGRVKGVL